MEILTLKQLFDVATIKVNNIEEIPLNDLADLLNKYSLIFTFIIKNLVLL